MNNQLTQGKSICLVMHDNKLQHQLVALLKKYASNIRTFEHINKFLSEPLSQAPSCLITSLNFAEDDGVDIIRRLGTNGLSIPVIVIATEDENVCKAVRVLQKGAVDYIQQPIMERDFLERVDKAVNANIQPLIA